jgi:hypothetical protein
VAAAPRDVKAENVVLEGGGAAGGRVFLVDFGGVQAAAAAGGGADALLGSTVVGTYGYMAPEQFRGAAVPASDLYGLGGTLLFLLSGAPQPMLRAFQGLGGCWPAAEALCPHAGSIAHHLAQPAIRAVQCAAARCPNAGTLFAHSRICGRGVPGLCAAGRPPSAFEQDRLRLDLSGLQVGERLRAVLEGLLVRCPLLHRNWDLALWQSLEVLELLRLVPWHAQEPLVEDRLSGQEALAILRGEVSLAAHARCACPCRGSARQDPSRLFWSRHA